MAQSLSKIYAPAVFSTKNRERTLPDGIRPDLHAYMGGTLKGLGCLPIEINTEPDHLHGLFLLARTGALSHVVGHLKKSSNDWLSGVGAAARAMCGTEDSRGLSGRREVAPVNPGHR